MQTMEIISKRRQVCSYSVLSVSKNPSTFSLVDETIIKFLPCHRDLGIIASSDLSWSNHYDVICSKAYRTFHLIRHSLSSSSSVATRKQLYLSLVKSKLSYCCQLWRPRLIKDIRNFERIQRRTTKFILQDYSSDYKTRLLSLNLLPLMHWYELQDMTFLIKCLKNPMDNLIIYDLSLLPHVPPPMVNSDTSSVDYQPQDTFISTELCVCFLPWIYLSLSLASIKQLLLCHLAWADQRSRTHFKEARSRLA